MHRDRIALLLFPVALALGAAVSCTTSDPVTPSTGTAGTSGGAGTSASGTAGTSATGTAGTSATGTAGTNATGTAGTSASGSAGTSATGTAGTSATGTAGTNATGTAGTSATGTAGTNAPADGGTDTGGGVISFATDIYPFLKTQCMPCHTKATNQDGGPLNMSTAAAAYTSLLGTATPVTGAAAKTDTGCKMLDSKKLRVEPGDPAHSYLYIKISNSDSTLMGMNCGPAMPETASNLTLTADQKTKVQSWIMGGAKP
jgi:hypothetical protein